MNKKEPYVRRLTKEEYIQELRHYLHKLPKEDYENAISHFTEYFEEAGPENEAAVMDELGTPKEAAAELVRGLLDEHTEDEAPTHKKMSTSLKVAIVAVALSPISWLGVILGVAFLITAVALLFSLFVAAASVVVATVVAGGGLIWEGFTLVGESLAASGIVIGGGVLGLALGLWAVALLLIVCKLILQGMVALAHWLTRKKEARHHE